MLDDRDAYTPGWKFSEWELRGVPLRLEIGPKDIEKQQVMLARRDTREKAAGADGRARRAACRRCSTTIQRNLFERALAFREEHTTPRDVVGRVHADHGRPPGFVIAPWCGTATCEADIKAATQATIRNLPIDAPAAPARRA